MPARLLTPELCKEKAAEARFLSGRTQHEAARIMLEHIAETWDRIAGKLVGKD
jgi:hypothetical protein